MAENTEGMDLTIGLKVDVSAFEKEWEAKYRKQIQRVLNAQTVSLKIDSSGIKNVEAEIRKMNTSLFREKIAQMYPTAKSAGLKELSAYYKQLEKDTMSAAKAQQAFSNTVFKSKIAQMYPTKKDGALAAMSAYYKELEKTSAAQSRAAYTAQAHNSALRTQKGILNGMPQFLNAYISVLGATRLVDNIRRVTAEFELQRTALRAIIQDKYLADQLFEQTITQAVESPFTAKELVTYTKQLAAYRIETEDLFDTTKMLADVSAGLGVSMDRLILAYGQVRAASVLRGTELRQFTEAGLPLVELLADKFSILKDRVVDTNEVFDMISKRQVPFEYVAQIFQELTSKGGMFFDMQRKQSETLYGVYQKLGDQLDLSFSAIGEKNMGVLRGFGELALYVAENMDKVVNAVVASGTAWGAYTVAQKLAAMYVGQTNAEMLKEIQTSKLREANALRMKAAITKLSVEELRRIATVKQLTLADVKSIAASKGYTSAVGARLIATKKITREVAMQAAAELQLTQAQIRQLSMLGKGKTAWYLLASGISRATTAMKAFIVSMASNPLTWVFGILSAIKLFVSKSKELKESIKAMRDSMLDQAESLEAAYGKVKDKLEDTNTPIKSQIVAYDTILRKNQEIYPLVQKRLEKVTDEAEKLDILKTTYEDIKRILDDERSAGAFMSSVENSERTFRSFEKDLNDVSEGITNVNNRIAKQMRKLDTDTKLYRQISADIQSVWTAFQAGEIDLIELQRRLTTIRGSATDWRTILAIDNLIEDAKEASNILYDFKNNLQSQLELMFPTFDFANLTEDQLHRVQNSVVTIATTGVNSLEDLNASGKKMLLDYVYNAYSIVRETLKNLSNIILDPDGPAGPTPADILRDELDVMKSAFDQYKKLAKSLGSGVAFEKVNYAFRELIENFKYLPKDLKVPTSISEYVDILKKALESEATDQKLRVFLKTNISDNEINDMVEAMKEALARAKEQVQRSKEANTFYEGLLSSGLGEPIAWQMTMDLYGANPMDIRAQMEKNLREAFKEKLELDLPLSLANAESIVRDNTDKIGQETADMLLGLISDLRNYDAETIKSLQSNLSKTSELEAKRIKIYRDSAAQIAKLQALSIPDTQKAAMQANIEQRKNEQLAALGWEEFKAGDLYTTLFSDLEKVSTASLTSIREKLQMLKEQLKDLPADQLKQVMSAITKLDKELLSRDPFSAIVDNIGSLFGGYKRLREAEQEYIKAQEIVDVYQEGYNEKLAERLDLEAQLQAARAAGTDTTALEQQLAQKEKEIAALRGQLDAAKKTARGKLIDANAEQEALSKLSDGLKGYEQDVKAVQDAFGEVRDIVELVGVDLDNTSVGALFDGIDAGLKGMQSIISMMNTIIALQNLMNASNPFGWIAIAVGALVGAATAIFNARANRLQKEIEKLEDTVHSLERAYQRLEDAAEKALGSDMIKVAKDQQKNLQAQAEAYRKMYEAESSKGKKKDDDKIRDYKEQYEDTLAEIQKVQDELVSTLMGSDLASAARDFAQSWIDAYASFSSTTDAMEEKFRDMINNLIVESMAAKIVQNLLKPIYDSIDAATSEDSLGGAGVTAEEIADISSLIPGVIDGINVSLEELMESLKQQGVDIQQGESNLTGISAAAAGITEDTALTLGAIGNNMVYYLVSIHDMLAARFAAEGAGGETSGPTLLSVQQAALTELRAIQNNTARSALATEQMVSALSSVISPIGVKSGAKAINVNL